MRSSRKVQRSSSALGSALRSDSLGRVSDNGLNLASNGFCKWPTEMQGTSERRRRIAESAEPRLTLRRDLFDDHGASWGSPVATAVRGGTSSFKKLITTA